MQLTVHEFLLKNNSGKRVKLKRGQIFSVNNIYVPRATYNKFWL